MNLLKKKTVFYFYKIIDKKNYSVIYCDLTTLLAIKKTLYIQYQQQITMPTNGFFCNVSSNSHTTKSIYIQKIRISAQESKTAEHHSRHLYEDQV